MAEINPKAGANTVQSLSPLLKEVYPSPKKRKTKSKRFDRIGRLLDTSDKLT